VVRRHEDDEIVAWAFDLPEGQAVLVNGGHVVTSEDVRRTGRRYARLLDAELAAVRQCRCP
jgi:hypothetical protein